MTVTQNENGEQSTARWAFWVTLLYTFRVIYLDSVDRWDVPDAAYAILTVVLTGTMMWAGGNRAAQHLAPAITAIGELWAKIKMQRAPRTPRRTRR